MKNKNVTDKLYFLRIFLFGEGSLHKLREKSNWKYFALFLVLAALLESLPTSMEEIQKIPFFFATSITKLFLLSFVVLGIALLLGMKSKVGNFMGSVFTVLFIALLLTTILAYVSIIIFQSILNLSEIAQLIQNILPFYTYALFAWGCEYSAGLSQGKGILLAILCLILIVLFGQIQIFFFQFY